MHAKLLSRRKRSAAWRPLQEVGRSYRRWIFADIADRLDYLEVLVELGEAIRPRVDTDSAAVDALNSCIHSVRTKITPFASKILPVKQLQSHSIESTWFVGQTSPSPDVIKLLLRPIVDLQLMCVNVMYLQTDADVHVRDVAANVVKIATRAGVDCSAICADLGCPSLAGSTPPAPTNFAGLYEIRKSQ